MKRSWVEARAKVEQEAMCRVCGRSDRKLDAAHVIPRSRVRPGAGEDPRNIVPLCGPSGCHSAYDLGGLDLTPYLTDEEIAYAEMLVGAGEARRRLTNNRLAA